MKELPKIIKRETYFKMYISLPMDYQRELCEKVGYINKQSMTRYLENRESTPFTSKKHLDSFVELLGEKDFMDLYNACI